jgi:LmbE family N-acetylglucosaminyl deacetylase
MTDSVLVIAAHPDDEVLGCGGTIARHADSGRRVDVLIVAEGATSRGLERDREAHRSELSSLAEAGHEAGKILGASSVELLDFPDNRMDSVVRLDLVKVVENAIRKHQPRTVLTHHSGDVNIDHRVLHDAVIAACRPQPNHPVKELLFFEVASSTEWRPPLSAQAFLPNWFEDISDTLERKLEALSAYASELREYPHPRSLHAVRALAQWRGATVGVRAAEAFHLGRAIRGLEPRADEEGPSTFAPPLPD